MKHSFFRPLVAILVATGALSVSAAHAAAGDSVVIDFEKFYNTATFFNQTDTKELVNPIATLTLKDVNGDVQGNLQFLANSGLPSKTAGSLGVEDLWMAGADKGLVTFDSGPSATSTYYKQGFYKQGAKYNYDMDFKSFNEGSTSKFTIQGVTVASFLTANGADVNGIMLNVTGVGKPYTGFLGLNRNVRFIGEVHVLPEPSTYALMGLGLVGVFGAVSRRSKRA